MMARHSLKIVPVGMLLILLLGGSRIFYLEIVRTFTADPTVWEREVAAFEAADRATPPPDGAILFVGSSSIRFWDRLAEDMAPMVVMGRGFGGAKLSDLVHFADRVILPYSPRAIVIHAGGNELTESPGNVQLSPEQALADFRMLLAKIRHDLPEIPIYYLALRPSRLPGGRDRLMELIKAECAATPDLEYLDAGDGLTLADGSPDPDLIRWDYIHLNRAGYEAWAPLVRARLLADLGAQPTSLRR